MKLQNIKIVIIDDSAFMRRVVKNMLEKDPLIEVLATAKDGFEGVEKVFELIPDVVIMDLEMPRMTGLEAIEIIMEKAPCPIIVLSSLTTFGAEATFEALEMGAADYVPKNISDSPLDVLNVFSELIAKIKAVSVRGRAMANMRRHSVRGPELIEMPKETRRFASERIAMVVIGASTGGPGALQRVIPSIPKGLKTNILVAVHMPKEFTTAFAKRINELSNVDVKIAEDGEKLENGVVLIAEGGIQTGFRKRTLTDTRVRTFNSKDKKILYRPCIDLTMASATEAYGGSTLGVILTGMGHDGTEGMKNIKTAGGKTLVQDEETSIIYGMPKSVVDEGVADKVVPLNMIAGEIVNMV